MVDLSGTLHSGFGKAVLDPLPNRLISLAAEGAVNLSGINRSSVTTHTEPGQGFGAPVSCIAEFCQREI